MSMPVGKRTSAERERDAGWRRGGLSKGHVPSVRRSQNGGGVAGHDRSGPATVGEEVRGAVDGSHGREGRGLERPTALAP
eukprot:365363-Chlamydomonas_euryale.AAC.2